MIKRQVALIVCLVFLMGCATMGLESPQTPKQRLAYGWTMLEGIYSKTSQYIDLRLISKDIGSEVVDKGIMIEDLLEASEKYLKLGDEVSMKDNLNLIDKKLIELNNFLLDNKGDE